MIDNTERTQYSPKKKIIIIIKKKTGPSDEQQIFSKQKKEDLSVLGVDHRLERFRSGPVSSRRNAVCQTIPH